MIPVALLLAAIASAGTPDIDCVALYERHLTSDMELSWREFDQTENRGFRVLAKAGCPRQAGDLIEAYLAHQQRMRYTLDWHLAQMRAEAGQTEQATVAARRAIRADESQDALFKWNAYVSAVIAYLEKDRDGFDRHRAMLAANADHPGNAMNLRFLDRLGRRFDASYAEALAAPGTD